METYYSISAAASYIGMSIYSLRRYDRQGTLPAFRSLGNQRRYTKKQLDAYLGICDEDYDENPTSDAPQGIPYCYCRVSSFHQTKEGNLDRQAARLEKYVKRHYGKNAKYTMIKEYGSGMNPNRPGLKRLIKAVQEGKCSVVYCAYLD